MSKIVTRGDLLARMSRTKNKATNVDIERRRRYLQEAYARVWYYLASADSGFGLTRRTYTMAAPTLDVIVLPDNYSRLRSIVVNPGSDGWQPQLVTDLEVDNLRIDDTDSRDCAGAYYQIEGPGSDWDETTFSYIPYSRRIRFHPALTEGTQVRIKYVSQPASLGDPTLDADDATTVDMLDEVIESVVVGYAVAKSANRDDQKLLERAWAELQRDMDDYLSFMTNEDQYGVDTPERYRRPRNTRWAGYR